MAHHVECRLGLISRNQVPGPIHQHKPQIPRCLGPSPGLPSNRPSLLLSPLPGSNVLPSQTVQILQHPRSIYHVVILAVVEKYPYVSQQNNNIRCITFAHILLETVVNLITAWMIVDVGWYSQGCFVFLQEICKTLVSVAVLPEIVVVHAAQVLLLHIIVIGQEIEIIAGLAREMGTF